jgi:DNA-binding response OmpR family regulator
MKKLMIVDDEEDICNFVKQFFGVRGFEVTCAFDGKEAVSIINAVNHDLVLMDIRMPNLDGIATLAKMREMRPQQKVIMVTCVDDLERMEEAKKLGALEYITKPLVLDELEKKVLSVFKKAEKTDVTQ